MSHGTETGREIERREKDRGGWEVGGGRDGTNIGVTPLSLIRSYVKGVFSSQEQVRHFMVKV